MALDKRVAVVARLVMSVCFFGVLAGCSSLPTSEVGRPEDVVKQRAAERWALLLQGKLDEAYEYLSPGSRDVMSVRQYKARIRPGRWKSAEVAQVGCSESVCQVTVDVEYIYVGREGKTEMTTGLKETWIKEGGSWWHVPRR